MRQQPVLSRFLFFTAALGLILSLNACGGSGPHMDLGGDGNQSGATSSPDEEGSDQGADAGADEDGPAPEQEYTFGYYEDIQPIFQQRCSLCHPGATPDDWTDYQQARGKAEAIGERVGNGSMPPGNATQMTEEEREMVLIWVSEGAPEGEGE